MRDDISRLFASIDEPYAAGLFEAPERSIFFRHCSAYSRWFDALEPVPYEAGERLYPAGNKIFRQIRARAVRPQYCMTYEVSLDMLESKCPEAVGPMREFHELSHWPGGWTHGIPNYRRILREGLASYRRRLEERVPADAAEADFAEGLLRILSSMEGFLRRSIAYLKEAGAPAELVSALEKVPFALAETYYEGLVAWNMIFYFDGCDNLGCLDEGLAPLYRGEDMTAVIAELFDNINSVDMWSCTLGPAYNDVTRQALAAVRGKRRPLLELRVREDMPSELWAVAAEDLAVGSTNPSFYNDRGIHDMLHARFPYIPESELKLFCGGGCTETNLEGLTRAGGTDADMNLLKTFERYLYENLAHKPTFESFFDGLCAEEARDTEALLDKIEQNYRYMSEFLPNPMRSLFFDDCIDRARDYNGGGARYSWTMNSESGLINVIDCLAAVRKLYYEERRFTAAEFCSLLRAEDKGFFALLKTCPCFGTDDEKTDAMGAAFAERVFMVYHNKKPTLPYLDGFTLTEHQFERYEGTGAVVGPTPDGRTAGQPTCDSLAALRGKAVPGPTAMLRSSAKLPQHLVEGISVVNLTLAKGACASPEILRALVLGYFAMGGIQLQVTVTSIEDLRDAMVHPEKHEDLLVRVGGYSEYFNRLSPALKQTVLDRNIHELGENK